MAPEGRHIVAVSGRRQFSEKNGYATCRNLPVFHSSRHRNFHRIPLQKGFRLGRVRCCRTAIQAEVSAFIAVHAHLLHEEGRQPLVRHGFLAEREGMTGTCSGAARA